MNILKCVILSAVLLALSACTDYVAEIDDQIKDLKAQQAQKEYSDDVDDFAEEASSSSEILKSSSSESPFNPNIEYGKLTDSRDGQTYKTVTIGDQVWMAENLNYVADSSFCYNNEKSNCDKYGRLYTWTAATTACPSGWHLPSKAEWETLFNAVGNQSTAGKVLKSTSGWSYSDAKSTDAFGFSALPAGYYGQGYYSEGFSAFFWISTENDSFRAYYMYLLHDDDSANLNKYGKGYGFSVRCLKDDGVMPESSSSSKVTESVEEASSSSEILKSSSSESPFNPNIEYGELIDSRDNQTYKTVKIGSQVWMAQNLNYETPASYCYGDNASNCTQYGRLYTWVAATTACPSGWHLPSGAEWETLFNAVGGSSTAGTKLKSMSGWNGGTDAFGFSALPAGYRDYDGLYVSEGNYAVFCSSSEYDSGYYAVMYLFYDDGTACLDYYGKNYGLSVRCLKNDEKTTESSSSNETPKSSSSQKTESSSSSSLKSSDASSSGEYKPYDHLADLGSEILSKSEYRQFTDTRNGRSYYYLTINGVDKNKNPASVTVMAENLNIGVRVDGDSDQKNDAMIERYCYDNDSTNCDKYGGLYQWAEMMQLPSECNTKSCVDLIKPNHQGICPVGWRLLTEDDFYVVLHADGNIHDAEDVRATSFGGYNYSGYSLVGAGYNWEYKFDYIGSATQWYYPVEFEADPDNVATVASMTLSSTSVLSQNVYKTHGLSVRCVMNQ